MMARPKFSGLPPALQKSKLSGTETRNSINTSACRLLNHWMCLDFLLEASEAYPPNGSRSRVKLDSPCLLCRRVIGFGSKLGTRNRLDTCSEQNPIFQFQFSNFYFRH